MLVKLIALILSTIAIMMANLCLGDLCVDPVQALTALSEKGMDSQLGQIIYGIRLPRLLTAALVGLALAVSGYLLQAVSRNDLADPYLTGVSSGAALGVALALILQWDFQTIPALAFGGGLTASLLVAYLARSGRGLSVPKLLLSGVALSAIATALINLAMTCFGTQLMSQGLNLWMLGGVSGRSWSELLPASFYVAVGLSAALAAAKQLRLLSLGEEAACALGLNVGRTQLLVLAAAVLLASTAVALSGMVGFVGLVAPHLARRIFAATSSQYTERLQIVAAGLTGAAMVLCSDLLARMVSPGQELPLGTLMALLGGPFFIYLLSRSVDQVQARG